MASPWKCCFRDGLGDVFTCPADRFRAGPSERLTTNNPIIHPTTVFENPSITDIATKFTRQGELFKSLCFP